jgi:hypothetical protein
LGIKETRDSTVLRVTRVTKDYRDTKAFSDHRVRPDLLETRVPRGLKQTKAIRVTGEIRVTRAREEYKDTKAILQP